MNNRVDRIGKVPLPTAHYMATAPLDTWLRLLFFPFAWIRPRYWLRLYVLLFTSTLATLITLPERVLFWAWCKLVRFRPERLPGPVFVLGYYRSGTTHLHYLLDCDPNLYSPKWSQALVPQGFVLSWTFLRLFMIPFMSGRRPMDAMDVGPEYAAEDHFGVNNWCLASTLPGKSVLPQSHDHYSRFNELTQLAPRELSRWRRYQLAFIRKLALLAGRRKLLLKSPSHTAHVEQLLELLAGVPNVKFLHISRPPEKVLRSNLWMHQVFQQIWNLQDPVRPETLQNDLLNEFIGAEESYLKAREKIPAGQWAEMRMQDLHADPIGEIKRVYAELDLPYSPEFESRLISYLDATSDFQPNQHAELGPQQIEQIKTRTAPLAAAFRHHEPTIAKVKPPRPARPTAAFVRYRALTAPVIGLLVMLVCAAVWFLVTRLDPVRYIQYYRFVWPAGLAIGYFANRWALSGSPRLGIWSAGLTFGLLLSMACYFTHSVHFAGQSSTSWTAFASATIAGLLTFHGVLWSLMGAFSSYRLAARNAS